MNKKDTSNLKPGSVISALQEETTSPNKQILHIIELFITNIDKLSRTEREVLINAIDLLSRPVMKYEIPGLSQDVDKDYFKK